MSKDITFDEWKSALEELSAIKSDSVPKGWVTCRRFAEMSSLSESQSLKKLRALVQATKAEKKNFRIEIGDRIFPIPHYRLKK